jgi:hypothetical protein
MPKGSATIEEKGTKMPEWAHNCVLQALSKVLKESQFSLAERLVKEKIGGVEKTSTITDGPVIKKVLVGLKFKPLIEGGCTWKKARQLMGGQNPKGRFFAIWWRNGKEDWTDKPTKDQGLSDHAFAIYCNDTDIEVPVTNMRSFDIKHPLEDGWVSVFIPEVVVPCEQRLVLPKYKGPKDQEGNRAVEEDRADRRFQYN